MTGALRADIRGMDMWLSVMESTYLKLLTEGATEGRCTAVLVFDRLNVNCEVKLPPTAEVIRVEIDNAPLDEVERDGD